MLLIFRGMVVNYNQNIADFFQELILRVHITHTNDISPRNNNKLWGRLTLLVLVSILGIVSTTTGEISTTVFLSDGNTPLALVDPNIPHVYRDIMVGTKLTIIISSDTNDYWVGDLFITGENRDYGVLTAASCLPAAGEGAFLYPWEDDFYQGFCFETDVRNAVPGDWFIIDYNATDIGDCNVGLYEWFSPEPAYEISFSHVRTRDFNNDTIVDFRDYAILASHWLETSCNAPSWCEGADLDIDGSVDINDLILFCQYWLERTK